MTSVYTTYLVVNGLIKVFDENIPLTGFTQGGVTLRPHNAASTTLDKGIVELLQSALA